MHNIGEGPSGHSLTIRRIPEPIYRALFDDKVTSHSSVQALIIRYLSQRYFPDENVSPCQYIQLSPTLHQIILAYARTQGISIAQQISTDLEEMYLGERF